MLFDSSTSMWKLDKSELCAISDTLVLTSATLSVVLRVWVSSLQDCLLLIVTDSFTTASGRCAAHLRQISVCACGRVFEMCITDNQLNSEERVLLCTACRLSVLQVYMWSHICLTPRFDVFTHSNTTLSNCYVSKALRADAFLSNRQC